MRKVLVRWGLIAATVVPLAAALCIVLVLPAAAAWVCPSCYGLKPAGEHLYVEEAASPVEIARIRADIDDARQRLVDFYPTQVASPPDILVCMTRACDRRLGGQGAKARAFSSRFITVSPDGRNPTILAHELAHIEFHERVGMTAMLWQRYPAWFDEGLAVIVSKDPRYLELRGGAVVGCLAPADAPLPVSAREWSRQAGVHAAPLYASAACRVRTWLAANHGAGGVIALARNLRSGGVFPN